MVRHDAEQTAQAGPTTSPAGSWTTVVDPRGGYAHLSVIAIQNRIFAEARGLHALDPSTGRELWVARSNVSGEAAIAYDHGMVFDAKSTGDIFAANASDGTVVWTYRAPRDVYGGLVAMDGLVVGITTGGKVLALNETDGTLEWTQAVANDTLTAPVISSGNVIVADASGNITAYALASGSLAWHREDHVTYNVSPIAAGGIILADENGLVRRISPTTGQADWETKLAGPPQRPATVDGGHVYVPICPRSKGFGCGIQALDWNTGATLWTFKQEQGGPNSPIRQTGDNLLYQSSEGAIYTLSARTGALLHKAYVSGGGIGEVLIVGDYVVFTKVSFPVVTAIAAVPLTDIIGREGIPLVQPWEIALAMALAAVTPFNPRTKRTRR